MNMKSLGYKINSLQKDIKDGSLSTKKQVKNAAEKIDVAFSAGYGNLSSEDKDSWYEQLAVNLFEKHNNWIPSFYDIGFGKELLDHSFDSWENRLPKKQHWKIVVTRSNFSNWQFNGIVTTYSREEAGCILKRFFNDTGDLGFNYKEPDSKSEHKASWIEINSKSPGSYFEYLKNKQEDENE